MHGNMFNQSKPVKRRQTRQYMAKLVGSTLQHFTTNVSRVAKLRIQWYIQMVIVCISEHQSQPCIQTGHRQRVCIRKTENILLQHLMKMYKTGKNKFGKYIHSKSDSTFMLTSI